MLLRFGFHQLELSWSFNCALFHYRQAEISGGAAFERSSRAELTARPPWFRDHVVRLAEPAHFAAVFFEMHPAVDVSLHAGLRTGMV